MTSIAHRTFARPFARIRSTTSAPDAGDIQSCAPYKNVTGRSAGVLSTTGPISVRACPSGFNKSDIERSETPRIMITPAAYSTSASNAFASPSKNSSARQRLVAYPRTALGDHRNGSARANACGVAPAFQSTVATAQKNRCRRLRRLNAAILAGSAAFTPAGPAKTRPRTRSGCLSA
eukprot:31191-Pelagococcus_subviridis.AAC.13